MKTMLIVDGNSILNRAFYGVRPLSTPDGLPTNACYGFSTILLKQLEAIKPDYAAVAFDLPAKTFRHKQYEDYKAGRRAAPEELKAQFPYARQLAQALGFRVLDCEGYEADDILGTLAHMCEEAGVAANILTGDRDSLQLITQTTHVLLATNSDTVVFDENRFRGDYGISPSRFVEVKALMGDSSDNIPGVVGIGEKTALKLISSYGTLEQIYEKLPESTLTKSVRSRLETGRESAFLSRELATIRRDAPINICLADTEYTGYRSDELIELFKRLQFTALIKRLGLSSGGERHIYTDISAEDAEALPIDAVYAVSMQSNSIYITDGRIYHKLTPSFSGPSPTEAFLCTPGRRLVVYDSKTFYTNAAERGIDSPPDVYFDIILAAYVLSPSDTSYDLAKLAASVLNETYDEEECDSTALIFRLHSALSDKLKENGLEKLYRTLELPLARVLSNMERRGFMIDQNGLAAYAMKLSRLEESFRQSIFEKCGREFNLNSPKQLGEVLFDKLGLPALKKTKSGYSTGAEILEKLRGMHPVVDDILMYRQISKIRSAYAEGLLRVVAADGRIHTNFNQTVAATGRLSSAEPNLQSIPVKQELGRELRRYFIAREGYVLIDADYSQIELRLLAHIADDRVMIEAFNNDEDIHAITASQVFGVPLELVTPEMRKRAKAVNFGIVYGIGEFSLAQDIGVTKYQAGEYIKSYMAKYSGVAEYMKQIVADARRDGFVTTMFGRRRYIPELSSPKASLRAFGERVAMNSPIQGAAADIIKLAMVNVERALKAERLDAQLILQIHDELIVEASRECSERAAQILRHEMECAAMLSVPLTVDMKIGRSWES